MVTTTFQQGQNGYNSTLDTMIRQKSPNSDYRNGSSINIDSSDSSGLINQGLLYFGDLFGNGPGQIPLGATITSATLTLNVTDATKQAFSLNRMLLDWHSAPNWTWNAYGNGVQADGTEAAAGSDLTMPSLGSGLRGLDVTSSLAAWMGGQANHGWLFSMAGSDGWDFSSSEGAAAPRLSVSYTVPETSLSIAQSDGGTQVTEGGAGDSVSIALGAAPTANVTVTLPGNADLSLSPTTLTFTPDNWNDARTVAISAIDDALVEGRETIGLTFSAASTDARYDGLSSTLNVVVTDNDTATPPGNPSVVAVHDTTQYKAGDPSGYGCSDPSGLAYVPGLNRLFIADSEHDESPFFSSANVFTVRTNGASATAAGASFTSFCREPTGLAYNSGNGFLYITDDDADKVFWVDPSAPNVKLGEFSVRGLGITDGEDPAYDPDTGHLFMLDGGANRLFELTLSGQLVSTTSLPSALTDTEAMAYDPYADLFYFAGGATKGAIFTVDRDGDLLSTLTLLNGSEYRHEEGHKPKIKGLTLAPSSDQNDGGHMSLYAADYGVDQVADGRLFEVDMGIDWPMV